MVNNVDIRWSVLVLFPWLLGYWPHLIFILFLLCIVQQPLRAVCCFSSPSTCINQKTICHQHSGSVGVNKRQKPAGETQMTQPCPSNRGEQVIFGGFRIHVHCVYMVLFIFVYVSGHTHLGTLWDYLCWKKWSRVQLPFILSIITACSRWCKMQVLSSPAIRIISHLGFIHSHACTSCHCGSVALFKLLKTNVHLAVVAVSRSAIIAVC